MFEIITTNSFLLFGISTFLGSGTGFIVVAFLSKKMIRHLLQKDIEKYKSDLSFRLKIDEYAKKYLIEQERIIINELWAEIHNIISFCSKYPKNDEHQKNLINQNNLNNINKKLTTSLSRAKPFIHTALENNITELLLLSDAESYKPEKYNELVEIENKIIVTIRKRLMLNND